MQQQQYIESESKELNLKSKFFPYHFGHSNIRLLDESVSINTVSKVSENKNNLALIILHFLEVLLHCAARDGHSDLVQMLIAQGIDVNIMDKVSSTSIWQ